MSSRSLTKIDHAIALFVAIGKGIVAPWPRPGQLAKSEIVITDRFE